VEDAKRAVLGERIAHGLLLLAVKRGMRGRERLLGLQATQRGGLCDV
jgi:acyl dehydratase